MKDNPISTPVAYSSQHPHGLTRRRRGLVALACVGALTLAACSGNGTTDDTTTGAGDEADMVLRNAVVWTGAPDRETATALAVTDGRITFVGDDDQVESWIGPATEVHDLDGRFVMPGLVDAHNHPRKAGENATQCSLDWLELSVDETLAALQDCLDAEAEQGVSTDQPFYANDWLNIGMTPQDTAPTADILDRLDTDRAVVVKAFDAHNSWANTTAIDLAGITADTPDPADGVIARNAEGAPSGFFMDGGQNLLFESLPQPSTDVLADQAADAVQVLYDNGITSFMEAATFAEPDFALAGDAWTAAIDAGVVDTLHTSVYVHPASWQQDPVAALATMDAWQEKYSSLDVKTAKFFLDGVPDYPAQTAYMLDPYYTLDADGQLVAGTSHGKQYMSDDLVREAATALLADGWSLHLHALGDGGVRQALDAIEAARTANPDQLDVRHTVVHLQMTSDEDAARFAELNTVANFQSQWFQRDALTMDGTKGFISDELWNEQYPIRTVWEAGEAAGAVTVAAGSDWPVDPLDPFLRLQLAVTRTNPDPPLPEWGGPLGPDQALTITEALTMFTTNSAWAMGIEDETGSLEPGKSADVIVLDQNLLEIDPSKIVDTTVEQTLLRGRLVHGSWIG